MKTRTVTVPAAVADLIQLIGTPGRGTTIRFTPTWQTAVVGNTSFQVIDEARGKLFPTNVDVAVIPVLLVATFELHLGPYQYIAFPDANAMASLVELCLTRATITYEDK